MANSEQPPDEESDPDRADKAPEDSDPAIQGLDRDDWDRILHAVRMFSINRDFARTIEKVERIYARIERDR